MNVLVEIPEELGRELAESPAALGRRIAVDLAVYYYQQEVVSLGKAAELSALPRGEFEAVLAERNIERPYSVADVDADLQWAKKVQ